MFRNFIFGFTCLSFIIFSCEARFDEPVYRKHNYDFIDHFYAGFQITDSSYIPFVHPDILFHNNRYYLTITPYYKSNDKLENPCIYISYDGKYFFAGRDSLNPLVTAPTYDHNDDPDIFFDDKSGSFIINYLETMRPDSQNVISLVSMDALHWQRKQIINYNLSRGDDFIVSPSLISYQDNYYLFYVNVSGGKLQIEFLVSPEVFQWNKYENQKADIDLPDGFIPWHLDVIKGPDCFYLLCTAFKHMLHFEHSLLLFKSDSLKHWNYEKELLNNSLLSDYHCKYVYRSTAIVEQDSLSIWYSYMKMNNDWNIGFTRLSLQD